MGDCRPERRRYRHGHVVREGKYLTTQQVLAAVYTTDRNDYPSDEAFANFRVMKGGQIA